VHCLELGRVALVHATKLKWLFCDRSELGLVAWPGGDCDLMSVAAPLKIWNNTRIEMNSSGTSSFC